MPREWKTWSIIRFTSLWDDGRRQTIARVGMGLVCPPIRIKGRINYLTPLRQWKKAETAIAMIRAGSASRTLSLLQPTLHPYHDGPGENEREKNVGTTS